MFSNKKCFECGSPAAEEHHVVPKSKGGTKVVPLCSTCHGLVHGMRRGDIRELTKAGIAAKRATGLDWGRPREISSEVEEIIRSMKHDGLTYASINTSLLALGHFPPRSSRWSSGCLHRIVNRPERAAPEPN